MARLREYRVERRTPILLLLGFSASKRACFGAMCCVHRWYCPYNRLLASRQPLLITDAPAREQSCKARLFSLDGEWFECSINRWNAWLSVEPADVVAPGMSGSPIISLDGRAFGLLSSPDQNPILMDDLPRRLLSEMISAEARDD
jgi:hypothetical protein